MTDDGGAEAMTCDDALERLLEAEPRELRREGGGALGAHLRECPRCARAAALLLEGEAELRRGLAGLGPETDVETVLRRRAWRRRRRRGPGRGVAAVVATAAAALVGLLLIGDGEEAPAPGGGERPGRVPGSPTAEAGAGFRVEPPPGRDLAVFQTEDPTIRVVWVF